MKMINVRICENRCWCEFCSREIKKAEKCLIIFKQARRGSTRVNICRDCLIRMGVECGIKHKDITRIKKDLILEKLKS